MFFAETDPMADGELTEEEALAASVIFVADIPSNILFNMGFMYNDIVKYTKLETPSSDELYW